METRVKDPERVRLGRLGALTVHARGRTNVGPARAAWEAKLAAEFGIVSGDLDSAVARRRMDAAMRIEMTRLARARWRKRKPVLVIETTEDGRGGGGRDANPDSA
jgi:hypothetical protein